MDSQPDKDDRILWTVEDRDNDQTFILRQYDTSDQCELETRTPYWIDFTTYKNLDDAAAALGEQCSVFYLTYEEEPLALVA